MLTRLHDRSLKGPGGAIVSLHQQIGSLPRAIGTEIADHNVKAFPPLRTIVYGEFKFHNQLF